MKKYLAVLLLILIWNSPCHAWWNSARGAVAVSGPASDSCTSGLLFSWHAETTDVTTGGVSGGVNNGCSVGDTTGAANGTVSLSTDQYKDGAKSIKYESDPANYEFTNTSNDIMEKEAGRVSLWVYLPDTTGHRDLIYYKTDNGNHYFGIVVLDGGALWVNYAGNGGAFGYNPHPTAMSAGWNFVVFSWSVAKVGGKSLRYGFSTDGSLPTNFAEYTDTLYEITANPLTVKVGPNMSRAGYGHYIDNVKIYDAW
jgi:hypothetical protein